MTSPRLRFDAAELPMTEPKLVDLLNRMLDELSLSPHTRVRVLELQVNATAVAATFPLTMLHGLSTAPVGLECIYARDVTDGSVFTSGVFPTWEPDSTGAAVVIRYLTGLTAGHAYSLRFRVSS